MIHSSAEQLVNFSRPFANLRILVADDNATNRKLLRVLLEVEGHTVLEADNGVTALQILEQSHVDAVISDILMPQMDGFRLCYEIRKNYKLKHIPFAVYTASYVSQRTSRLHFSSVSTNSSASPHPGKQSSTAYMKCSH